MTMLSEAAGACDIPLLDETIGHNLERNVIDMVIRRGENIYPREVEEFLYTHLDIEEVQVVGVPDEKYGEELCAWVKTKAGRAALDASAIAEFAHIDEKTADR